VTSFILIAAALVVLAAATVVIPLLRRSTFGTPPALWAALATFIVLGGGGAAVYGRLGDRAWTQPQVANENSAQVMVGRLARRLERNPEDLNGWLLLGRSYFGLEEFPLAARAFERADQLAGGGNIEAMTGLGEALVFDDERQLSGRAGQLFEKALALDPKSGKALFYGAAAAQRRGDLQLARQRFQSLLDQSPPEQVRAVLSRQIAALDQYLAAAPAAQAQAQAAPTATPGTRQAAAVAIRVHVSLDPKLAARVPPGAPCFIFVRSPGVAGPPLAVRKVAQTFPQTIELGPADAMIAGLGIQPNQDVEVVARISISGTPQAHSGDLFGSVRVRTTAVTEVNVQINQLSP